ncbi:MAG: HEAT repeat domain-containing protein [Phycisphaerae bacterium]|nr:HEAT repeat domain-containing protein [Phycisphaerae bacterium]
MRQMSAARRLLLGLVVFAGGCVAGYAPSLNSPDPAARIRAIRQVTEKHDRGAVPLLVDRLEDEDEAVRFYAIAALERLAGTDMGYKYYKPSRERLPAVRRWRRYVRNGASSAPSTQTAARPE